jgi:hypothetical protein
MSASLSLGELPLVEQAREEPHHLLKQPAREQSFRAVFRLTEVTFLWRNGFGCRRAPDPAVRE